MRLCVEQDGAIRELHGSQPVIAGAWRGNPLAAEPDLDAARSGLLLAWSGTLAACRLCLHPHSRHVLSDTQSCRWFLQQVQGRPFEVALAPASILEPAMLADVEDHLVRAFEGLADRCGLVILHDVTRAAGGERLEAVPLGEGLLPRELVLDLLDRHVPPGTPVVIPAGQPQRQAAWLARG